MNRIWLILFLALVSLQQRVIQEVYTIHHLNSYRSDLQKKSLGCSYSVIYGVYLYPFGLLDVLKYIMSHHSCFNSKKYVKLFGTEQIYEMMLRQNPKIIAKDILKQFKKNNLVINWKHDTDSWQKQIDYIDYLIRQLKVSKNTIYLKLPASYFCKKSGNKKLMQLQIQNYIVEMYGQQPGKYLTYEDHFGQGLSQQTLDYPNQNCPKFPTYLQLQKNFPNKNIHIEKTLQSEQAGYINKEIKNYIQKAGDIYRNKLFFDGNPNEVIKF